MTATIWLDVGRQALRDARRHPAYSAFAILTLAAAIGGGTLLFSLYDAIALRALPVNRPSELVSVRDVSIDPEGRAVNFGRLSLEDFEALRDGAAPLADLGAYASGETLLRVREHTERAEVQWVDPRYFDVLGISALRGRVFVPGDDPKRGGTGGVVLTEETWRRLFGSDPGALREKLELDGVSKPVLGVLPAGFKGFQVGAEPAMFALAREAPSRWAFFRLFGRLRPGAGRAALQARLGGTLAAIRARQPGRKEFMVVDGKSSTARERIQIVDGRRGESDLRGEVALPLALVGGLLGLVLLVLSSNLANLLAVRALSGRGAAAIRMALGAPRSAVVGAWFAESLLLTFGGAALGMIGITLGGRNLLRWAPLPPWVHGLTPTVDGRALALAASIALLIGLLVGGLAAWEQAHVAPELRLREEGLSTTLSRGGIRWRNVLIACQVALSVVLLVAMGLFVRSAAALLDIDTGFPLQNILTFPLNLPDTMAARGAAQIEALREEIESLPGVASAGFSGTAVLGGERNYAMAAIEGYEAKNGEVLMLNTVGVSPGFFGALKLSLLSGRLLEATDTRAATAAAVVNRRFAERYFGRADPLGRRISFDYKRQSWRRPQPDDLVVVGIVDDRMISDVREEPTPRLYVLPESPSTSVDFYLRSAGAPMALAPLLERLIRQRIPEAALGTFQTLADQRDRSLRREILTRDLTLLFGALAAALAALGLFAVLSYVIGERRREFGLRQALGATPTNLLYFVLADGLRPVAWGLAIGFGVAISASRLAATQLYGVTPRDSIAFLGAVVVMALVGLGACLFPAVRASRTGPALALQK